MSKSVDSKNKIKPYRIINTNRSDLDFIYWLFEEAISYQKKNNYFGWVDYDRKIIQKEIEEQRQFKIVIEHEIVCIFSICYSDEILWRDKEKGDAIYFHRIIVNPNFRGQKHFEKILEWGVNHLAIKKLNFIRMDTWAKNQKIIDYYRSFGFQLVENYLAPDSVALPITHRNIELALLEFTPLKLSSMLCEIPK